eukprot:3215599-Pleurochrysis_carterae.AAC.4
MASTSSIPRHVPAMHRQLIALRWKELWPGPIMPLLRATRAVGEQFTRMRLYSNGGKVHVAKWSRFARSVVDFSRSTRHAMGAI